MIAYAQEVSRAKALTVTLVADRVALVRITVGDGGWVRVDDPSRRRPGATHVRFGRSGPRDRWRPIEVYVFGGGEPVTGAALREVPLAAIEAQVASNPSLLEQLNQRADRPAVPPGVLSDPRVMALVAERYGTPSTEQRLAELSLPIVDRDGQGADDNRPRPRLGMPPDDRLTDDFLRDVARAYADAVRAGRHPGPALAEEIGGVSVRTVQRWIYTARKRGVMPSPGRRGVVG